LIARLAKQPTETLIAKPQTVAPSSDGSDDEDCAKEEKYHPDEGRHNPWDAQGVDFEMLKTRHLPRLNDDVEAEAYQNDPCEEIRSCHNPIR